MSGSGSDEFARARLVAATGEIVAARMAIAIHERAVSFFDNREQPLMSLRARDRADRAREMLRRALAEQYDIEAGLNTARSEHFLDMA